MKSHPDDDRLVTVCSSCNRASCWQDEFRCSDFYRAGTKQMTVRELLALRAESPQWYSKERIEKVEGVK